MGFDQLETAQQPVPLAEITSDKVAWRGDDFDDETALGLVLADIGPAEQYVQSKNLTVEWERADNNFRAFGIPKNWSGTESQRSGLAMPVVMEAVNKLVALLYLAFFSDEQPFLLEAIGNVPGPVLRAKEKLLLWATQLSGFKDSIRECLLSAVLYGFCVGRWGWKTSTIHKKKYELATNGTNKVKRLVKDYEIRHPTFENIELRKHRLDATLRVPDVRKGRFNFVQVFVDANWLDDHRTDPTYKNIPTREELATILSAKTEVTEDSLAGSKNMSWRDNQAAPETEQKSIDPLKQPLEILEYITDDRVITVLQRKIVIRNEATDFGRSTCVSAAFVDVPGSAYGFGVSKLLAGEQYLQTSVLNSWMDVVALILNPGFTAAQGLQTTAQNIKLTPGRILTGVDLKPIPIPNVGAEALEVLQTSENRAAKRVGTNGADNMPTQALRTAEGVNAFNQGAVEGIQFFIERFAENVFIPVLEAFLDVMYEKLEPDDIKNILSEVDGKAYEDNVLDIYNSRCRILTLTSTKLTQRRSASQLVPLFLQLAGAGPVQEALTAQGLKFNFAELLEQAIDLGGLDWDSLVIPATPQDIQRALQIASPQVQQAQIQAQQQQQKHQDDLENIQETALGRAGVNIISHAIKSGVAENPGAPI